MADRYPYILSIPPVGAKTVEHTVQKKSRQTMFECTKQFEHVQNKRLLAVEGIYGLVYDKYVHK